MLEPRHVVVPLREQLPAASTCGSAGSPARRPSATRCTSRTSRARSRTSHYDQLIVNVGSVSRTLPIPGLAEHGRGFKSLPEAIALRNHVLRTLEQAETLEDGAARREFLTYVFVGAGYAGLEGLAELQDFVADILDLYPRCRRHRDALDPRRGRAAGHAGDPREARRLRRARAARPRHRDPHEHDARRASPRITPSCPTASACRRARSCWTAGVKPQPVVAQLGLPLTDRGRIVSDKYMQVAGHDNVWAIGDCAAVPDPARKGEPCPPTAQHAIRQGRVVARNVAAALGAGGRKRPFKYKTKGVFVDMGRRKAVAMTGPITWSGTPAWILARTYHLAAMPGMGRRARLLVDWNIGLLFGRDTAELGGVAAVKPLAAQVVDAELGNGAARAPDAAMTPR